VRLPPAWTGHVGAAWAGQSRSGRGVLAERQAPGAPGGAAPARRHTCWFDHGGKEYEAVFVHGQVNGVATRWHRNGVKASEQYYANGKRDGPRYSWDENGVMRKEEHFVGDLPDGTWITWDDKGKIKAQQKFERGVPKS
jgi:hypothetical protein